MAGRVRLPPPHLLGGGRGPVVGPGPYGPGLRSHMGPPLEPLPPTHILERKIVTQHAEIQRLLTENQRLATTHVALRQELAVAQQELHRLQQVFSGLQTEKEQQLRALVEKSAKMEVDLQATETFRVELQRAQADAQKLISIRQELSVQIQQLTQELHIVRTDAQQVPVLKAEIDGFRQEIQRSRNAFELEKKANMELLEQRAVMEKNLVSMAREVEKLRAELTNADKKARVGSYVGGFTGSESAYSTAAIYGDSYGISQVPDSGLSFGPGSATSWGGYEIQRSGPLGRR